MVYKTNMLNSPKVFISYSYDSQEHREWVINLAEKLKSAGIIVIIDVWDLHPGDDITFFMESAVARSDRVLLVCTEEYVKKADQGRGGVGYERLIVTGELVNDIVTNKFVPIVRGLGDGRKVPRFLATRLYVDLNDDPHFDERLNELIEAIKLGNQSERVTKHYGEKKQEGRVNWSFGTWIGNLATIKVHKLVVLWIQLVLTNFLVFILIGSLVGGIIGFFAIPAMFLLAFIISWFCKGHHVTSAVISGIIFGVTLSWVAYLTRDYGDKIGFLYGAFYGASLASFFSLENKKMNLWKAIIITMILTVLIGSIGCGTDYNGCFGLINDFFSNGIEGGVLTLVLGIEFLILYFILNSLEEFLNSRFKGN